MTTHVMHLNADFQLAFEVFKLGLSALTSHLRTLHSILYTASQ